MAPAEWHSEAIEIDDKVWGDVRANAHGIALDFHDDRWLFDVQLDDERALAIAAALNESVIQCRAMRASK